MSSSQSPRAGRTSQRQVYKLQPGANFPGVDSRMSVPPICTASPFCKPDTVQGELRTGGTSLPHVATARSGALLEDTSHLPLRKSSQRADYFQTRHFHLLENCLEKYRPVLFTPLRAPPKCGIGHSRHPSAPGTSLLETGSLDDKPGP